MSVTQATGCSVVSPDDRWIIAGHDVTAVGRARLCGPGICSIYPQLMSLSLDLGSESELRGTILSCTAASCSALFRLEPIIERRSASAPPLGVERRRENLVSLPVTLLREGGPFMDRLSPAARASLVDAATATSFGDGELLLPQDVHSDSLFIVADGEVEVRRKSERDGASAIIAVLGRGECFGEMSMLTGEMTSAAVFSRGSSEVLALTHAQLEELLPTSAELNRAFMQMLAARLRSVNVALESELGRGILGQLSTMSASDVVQTMTARRLTGTLAFTGQLQAGRMGFRDGQVVSAVLGGLQGEEAFHALAGWSTGAFRFEPGTVDAEPGARIDADTMGLLIESMHRIDEADL